jgi:hypothetical protein
MPHLHDVPVIWHIFDRHVSMPGVRIQQLLVRLHHFVLSIQLRLQAWQEPQQP